RNRGLPASPPRPKPSKVRSQEPAHDARRRSIAAGGDANLGEMPLRNFQLAAFICDMLLLSNILSIGQLLLRRNIKCEVLDRDRSMATAATILIAREDLSIPGAADPGPAGRDDFAVEDRFFDLLHNSKPHAILLDLSRVNGAGVETILK